MGLQGVGKCSLFILLCAEALLLRLNQRVEAHDLSDIVQIGFARARFSAFVRRIGAARCELAEGGILHSVNKRNFTIYVVFSMLVGIILLASVS